METSWMFDQFSFPAENDFVQSLVAEGGVQYAVGTMENHWFGYLGDDGLLDGLRDFGVTHVRIPVGYWTFDTPVTLPNGTASSSAADIHTYGLNPEGFVTGGVNALEWMLDRLEQRNISVLLDLHAPPGVGSQCQSYSGQQVSDVSKSFWQGKPEPSVTGCTSGSSYASSRDPSGATWMQVGLDIVDTMANWTAAMNRKHNGIITHFELVNEPGLGWDGVEDTIKQYTLAAAKRVHAHFPSSSAVTTTVNFIGANEAGAGDWVASMVAAGKLPTPLVDYHFYYNRNGPTSMDKLLKEKNLLRKSPPVMNLPAKKVQMNLPVKRVQMNQVLTILLVVMSLLLKNPQVMNLPLMIQLQAIAHLMMHLQIHQAMSQPLKLPKKQNRIPRSRLKLLMLVIAERPKLKLMKGC